MRKTAIVSLCCIMNLKANAHSEGSKRFLQSERAETFLQVEEVAIDHGGEFHDNKRGDDEL